MSPHSQTKRMRSAPTVSAIPSTRSLNSRKRASFRAIRSPLADTGAFSPSFRLRGRWKTQVVERSAERAAASEARFRQANEQIHEKVLELGVRDGRAPYLCECENERCTTVVLLAVAEYEDVRSGSRRFL